MSLQNLNEWKLRVDTTNPMGENHPYHHHTVHYQINEAHGPSVFGKVGDWRDTNTIYRDVNYTMRFVPEFEGIFFVHCHILGHEDVGMLTFADTLEEGKIPDWLVTDWNGDDDNVPRSQLTNHLEHKLDVRRKEMTGRKKVSTMKQAHSKVKDKHHKKKHEKDNY